ncbi:hypothetical protein ACJX0J_019607, partial [Zea mays]
NILLEQEIKMKQRARERCIIEGDENTKYFDLKENGNKGRMRIIALNDNENTVTNEDGINLVATKCLIMKIYIASLLNYGLAGLLHILDCVVALHEIVHEVKKEKRKMHMIKKSLKVSQWAQMEEKFEKKLGSIQHSLIYVICSQFWKGILEVKEIVLVACHKE